MLHNGLGRYQDALSAARRAVHFDAGAVAMLWPYGELVEAAVRTGDTDTARHAYDRLADATNSSGTDWAVCRPVARPW